jgi:hypothetical protein
MANTATSSTAPYEPNAAMLSEGLPNAAPQQGASQWAPNSIDELEKTDEQSGESGESGDLAKAVALVVEEAYADLHQTENT